MRARACLVCVCVCVCVCVLLNRSKESEGEGRLEELEGAEVGTDGDEKVGSGSRERREGIGRGKRSGRGADGAGAGRTGDLWRGKEGEGEGERERGAGETFIGRKRRRERWRKSKIDKAKRAGERREGGREGGREGEGVCVCVYVCMCEREHTAALPCRRPSRPCFTRPYPHAPCPPFLLFTPPSPAGSGPGHPRRRSAAPLTAGAEPLICSLICSLSLGGPGPPRLRGWASAWLPPVATPPLQRADAAPARPRPSHPARNTTALRTLGQARAGVDASLGQPLADGTPSAADTRPRRTAAGRSSLSAAAAGPRPASARAEARPRSLTARRARRGRAGLCASESAREANRGPPGGRCAGQSAPPRLVVRFVAQPAVCGQEKGRRLGASEGAEDGPKPGSLTGPELEPGRGLDPGSTPFELPTAVFVRTCRGSGADTDPGRGPVPAAPAWPPATRWPRPAPPRRMPPLRHTAASAPRLPDPAHHQARGPGLQLRVCGPGLQLPTYGPGAPADCGRNRWDGPWHCLTDMLITGEKSQLV